MLYRNYAFSTGETGELSASGYRYRQVEGALAWEDGAGARWTLQRGRWLLSSEAAAAQGKAPEQCRKIRGDEAEITAAPPEFPQVR